MSKETKKRDAKAVLKILEDEIEDTLFLLRSDGEINMKAQDKEEQIEKLETELETLSEETERKWIRIEFLRGLIKRTKKK